MRALIPVVKQTSGMDCGPAALHAAAVGLGVDVTYEEVRRRCNTDVDGTSINALEDTAAEIGLEVAQQLYPIDEILHPGVMPALLLVRGPADMPHVVVAWKRVGRLVQVMDPGVGRRWMTVRTLGARVIGHPETIDAEAAAAWLEAAADELDDLARRLGAPDTTEMTHEPLDRRLTHAAALRATEHAVARGSIRRGSQADELCRLLTQTPRAIPARHWFVRPDGDSSYAAHGGVALPLAGPDGAGSEAENPGTPSPPAPSSAPGRSRSWAGVLASAAGRHPAAPLGAIVAVLGAEILQIYAFWQLFTGELSTTRTVVLFTLAAVATALASAGFGWLASTGASRAERELRRSLLACLPAKQLAYVRSRPRSDLLMRFQAAQNTRHLVVAATTALLAATQVLAVAVVTLFVAPVAALAFVAMLGVVALVCRAGTTAILNADEQRHLHTADLSHVTYEAAAGATALRGAGGETAVRAKLVALSGRIVAAARVEARRSASFGASLTLLASLTTISVVGLAMALDTPTALLALLLLALALTTTHVTQLGELARRFPAIANATDRAVALLGEGNSERRPATGCRPQPRHGAGVTCRELRVDIGGRTVLDGVDLDFAPGSRTLLVGHSGAGKSTFLATVVGLHTPTAGALRVGSDLFGGARGLDIAWCSAETTLVDATLRDNLTFGLPPDRDAATADVIESVLDLCELRPHHGFGHALDDRIGADGSLLSSGEAQLVRFARALMRRDARLVVVDECLRGVDPQRRVRVLARALVWWKDATVIAASHADEDEIALFDRVVALDAGTVASADAVREVVTSLVATRRLPRESTGNWQALDIERLGEVA